MADEDYPKRPARATLRRSLKRSLSPLPQAVRAAPGAKNPLRKAFRRLASDYDEPAPFYPPRINPAPTKDSPSAVVIDSPAAAPGPKKAAAAKRVRRPKRRKTFERMRATLLDKFGREGCLNGKHEAMAADISPLVRGPKQKSLKADDWTFRQALGSINDETGRMIAEGKPIT